MTAPGIIVTGASGRMGSVICRAVHEEPSVYLAGAVEAEGSPAVGEDIGRIIGAGELRLTIEGSLERAVEWSRSAPPPGKEPAETVVVDFTSPTGSAAHAAVCARMAVPIVIGSTGLGDEELGQVQEAAKRVPVVMAPNMSVGVNLLLMLARRAAQVLGEDYDVEILEAHHRMKEDAPSGTALRMAEVVAETLGRNLGQDAVYERRGRIGARSRSEIGIQTLRGGDVVGEHTLYFLGDGERVELTHKAGSRMVFVKGAIRAAAWLVGRSPGLYGMEDVLGIG